MDHLEVLFSSEDNLNNRNDNPLPAAENNDTKDWQGTDVHLMFHNSTPWNYYCPELKPSRHHTVLFEMPANLANPPKPFYSSNPCFWNFNSVKMPFSPKNLFPVKEEGKSVLKQRWDIIKSALTSKIGSVTQLEEAIFSYNLRHRKFHALQYFFKEVLDEEEANYFFGTLLPNIAQLALKLPDLIHTPIPLLKQGKPHSITFSQEQIASLLANAFFCTFPWRKDAVTYPGINFNRLFECNAKDEHCIIEKIKCLLHYFRRVCNKAPTGIVTFERKHLSRTQLPRWDKLEKSVGDINLHVTSNGTIEFDGKGFLQVDFANSMVGGGVLSWGCVQEEIRFVICPELIVSRLITEQLAPNEALLMIGAECFSNYRGYANTFTWSGNYNDETPHDGYGRRRTTIIAIDALYYANPFAQFYPSKMLRELNKAYVGYYEPLANKKLAPVATGNWGCGAFRGNLHLKALIQIMACTAANRNIVYYTFGDKKLQCDIHDCYKYLADHHVTVAQLWRFLCQFCEAKISSRQLLQFVKQAHNDSLQKKDLTQKSAKIIYTKPVTKLQKTSPETEVPNSNEEMNDNNPSTSASEDYLILDDDTSSDEDIIRSSQKVSPKKLQHTKRCTPKESSPNLFSSDDEHDKIICESFLAVLEKAEKKQAALRKAQEDSIINSEQTMEVCDATPPENSESTNNLKQAPVRNNRTILEYFLPVPKK